MKSYKGPNKIAENGFSLLGFLYLKILDYRGITKAGSAINLLNVG